MSKMHPRRAELAKMMAAQGGCCCLCGCWMTIDWGHKNTATYEHIVPGGSEVKAACWVCNNLKGRMTLEAFRAVFPTVEELTMAKDRHPAPGVAPPGWAA